MAIRSAVTMGLNLRSESGIIPHVSKETRYRMWWALLMLDTVLCVMTGRPPSTGVGFCTTPAPVPYREEDFSDDRVVQLITNQALRNALLASLLHRDAIFQTLTDPTDPLTFPPGEGNIDEHTVHAISTTVTPSISLYLLYTVDLTCLMREAIEALYAPRPTRRSWLDVDLTISNFNNTADHLLSRLPPEFHFMRLNTSEPFVRQRASLGFRFYTTKIVILQPCLRRLASTSPGQTSWSSICEAMAGLCVQAAREMLALLPDEPDAIWLYGVSPWWCVLHYVMQSTTVLFVELFARTRLGSNEVAGLAEDIKKALCWLREMSTRDPSARQAWLVCMEIVSRHGSKFGLEVDADI